MPLCADTLRYATDPIGPRAPGNPLRTGDMEVDLVDVLLVVLRVDLALVGPVIRCPHVPYSEVPFAPLRRFVQVVGMVDRHSQIGDKGEDTDCHRMDAAKPTPSHLRQQQQLIITITSLMQCNNVTEVSN